MFGLLMFIGFLVIGIIVKDAMFIIAGGVFYIGWQICFLGTTISKLKNESDDISGKKLLTITMEHKRQYHIKTGHMQYQTK